MSYSRSRGTPQTLRLCSRGAATRCRAKLARLYRQSTGRTPSASALADSLNVLAGEALDAEAEPVHLRLRRMLKASSLIWAPRTAGQ